MTISGCLAQHGKIALSREVLQTLLLFAQKMNKGQLERLFLADCMENLLSSMSNYQEDLTMLGGDLLLRLLERGSAELVSY